MTWSCYTLVASSNGSDSFSPLGSYHLSSFPTFHSQSRSISISPPSASLSFSLFLCLFFSATRKKKMLLGKRTRPEIRRTTSMTGITFDLSQTNGEAPQQHQSDNPIINYINKGVVVGPEGPVIGAHNNNNNNSMNSGTKTSSYQEELLQQHHHNHFFSMLSPRNQRRSSEGDFIETAHFLRTCGLCKRRLASGRDIYMYRGDTAFCSLECREQQMKQDEGKEKFKASLATKNEDRHASTSTTSSKSSSGKSQTVAAA